MSPATWIRRHPVQASVFSFLFMSFPPWAEAIWALFSSKPIVPTLWSKLFGDSVVPPFSALWITIPLGLLMLSLIFREARKTKAGKARLGQPTIQPKVIPVKYGKANQHELGNEGLFLKNLGEPAVDIVVHPFELGARTVTFSGPEVPYLDTGDTRFLAVAVETQPHSFSTDLFSPFRDWQREVGDLSREATGRVTYKDVHGYTYETIYQIGVDVLNSDGGMVVRFVGSKKS